MTQTKNFLPSQNSIYLGRLQSNTYYNNPKIQKSQMKHSVGDNIKVFIRVRPFNDKEKSTQPCVLVNQNTIQMRDKELDHRFSFDKVFQGGCTQEEVYSRVGHEVVESAFEGFNGTVFAYGQTSSGKTHTCIGPDYIDKQKRGILPRMVAHIYQKIKQEPTYIEFRIKISMIEIYMQRIKDLLDTTKSDLKIREKVGKGIYIQDVTEEYVASQEQTINFIKKGIANRSVGQTLMNDTSSRSHMAFIITLYQNNLKDASAKSGKIILVDLAGSEKISKTGAQGKLLDQAKQINKSLLALGNVINSLTENKMAHIPYRDSKLTRLLQESLGGNAKTNLIINISPSQLNEQQTLSSLRFGNRAKQIKNKPKVNREYTVAQLLLLLQKAQKRIQELQLAISEMSVKKMKITKKSSQIYVENLLDSDHPILETDQEQGQATDKEIKIQNLSLLKQRSSVKDRDHQKSRSKLHFQSQCVDSSEQQKQQSKSLNSQIKQKKVSEQTQLVQKLEQEKQVLAEEIQMLNIEKVEATRELDILQQKYEVITKQNKYFQSKLSYLTKQNQKLLEKLISQTCLLQDNQIKILQYEQKINLYEQQILNIAAMQQKQSVISTKIFGTSQSQLAAQTKKIADMVRTNKSKQDQIGLINLQQKIQKQIQANQNKDIRLKELEQKNKKLEEEIMLFKHLENIKEAFIQEKLRFGAERQRLYKDLENRIEKVLQLEQRLDQQIQKRKYYEELIKSEQSQKNRKILVLQQHLNEVSQNYYVLKGQQSSWGKDTKRIEGKLDIKNKRIVHLQKQIMGLKQQIENLKLELEDLQINHKDQSILDLDLSLQEQGGHSKIVKIIRSSSTHFKEPENLFTV